MVKEAKKPSLVWWIAAILLLIGIVAVLIPVMYHRYTAMHSEPRDLLRGKSSYEAPAYLGAIRTGQVAFYAEWSYWVGNQPPTPVLDRSKNDRRIAWDNNTRFSIIGFVPLYDVYCSYSLEGSDWPTETEGFTARAECDFDGDGQLSVWTITSTSTEITHSGDNF